MHIFVHIYLLIKHNYADTRVQLSAKKGAGIQAQDPPSAEGGRGIPAPHLVFGAVRGLDAKPHE